MFVTWNKDLEIGVPFVDADHKVLINLLNQVHECIEKNEESTVLGSVLDALVEYTDYHFQREEKLMELSAYEGLDAHQDLHRKLYHQVRSHYHKFEADEHSVSAIEIRDFLTDWLIEHIQGHDFEYRDACVGNTEASDAAGRITFLKNNGTGFIPFPEWHNLRVMLVDDNANFRRLVKTILRAVGIRNIDVVASPVDGVARLAQRPADVVLCDWVMEEMNGTEFARRVSELDLPTRVVLLTGYSVDVLKERSSDVGISDYLEKPIKAQALLESITRVVTTPNSTN